MSTNKDKKKEMENRALELANYCIKYNATVRQLAAKFLVSKSTVHKDLTERLQKINLILYKKVKEVLEKNKSERHIRGGMATKRKFLEQKSRGSLYLKRNKED